MILKLGNYFSKLKRRTEMRKEIVKKMNTLCSYDRAYTTHYKKGGMRIKFYCVGYCDGVCFERIKDSLISDFSEIKVKRIKSVGRHGIEIDSIAVYTK